MTAYSLPSWTSSWTILTKLATSYMKYLKNKLPSFCFITIANKLFLAGTRNVIKHTQIEFYMDQLRSSSWFRLSFASIATYFISTTCSLGRLYDFAGWYWWQIMRVKWQIHFCHTQWKANICFVIRSVVTMFQSLMVLKTSTKFNDFIHQYWYCY